MSGIMDLLQGPLGQQIISGVAGQVGESEEKTGNLLQLAVPVLMGAMQKNASSTEGASGLLGALGNHSGDILGGLGSFFEGGVDENAQQEGGNIIGHLLGNKQTSVESALSQQSGINADTVGQILKIAAPLIMGLVGKQTQEAGVSDASGLTSVLGNLVGNSNQDNAASSILTSLIDKDGDGNIIDDVGGMLGGLFGGK